MTEESIVKMFNNRKNAFLIGALICGGMLRGAAAAIPGTFQAKDFFQKIVGMTEDDFRNVYGWDENAGHLKNLSHLSSLQEFNDWLSAWTIEYPSRAAIPQSDSFSFVSVGDLDQIVPPQPLGVPQFNVILYDPKDPLQSDIRVLQAYKKNKNAVFQIASTLYGPLEGGMSQYSAKLGEMLKHPVQGEWASVGAAGATIFRKYFMPTVNFLRRRDSMGLIKDPPYYYLLHNLSRKAPLIVENDGKARVDRLAIANYKFDIGDSKKVGIFAQKADVTSSYGGRGRGPASELTALRPGEQTVFQIFASAYDMNYKGAHANKNVEAFSKMLLRGMYRGVIKKAYQLGAKNVYLTLLGGGAFRNNITWIGEALNDPDLIDFIKKAGLTVNLIYRPDKPRQHAVRTPAGDKVFLQSMFEMADAINGSNLADKELGELINNYVDYSYAHAGSQASQTAQQITAYLQGGGAGPLVQAEVKSAAQEVPLDYIEVKRHGKNYGIGWLFAPVHGDYVLISWREGREPKLHFDGTKNFEYVSPNAPSIPLPKGLYYWYMSTHGGSDIPLQLSNRQVQANVRHTPYGKNFAYYRQNRNYVNTRNPNMVWDANRIHREIHEDMVK